MRSAHRLHTQHAAAQFPGMLVIGLLDAPGQGCCVFPPSVIRCLVGLIFGLTHEGLGAEQAMGIGLRMCLRCFHCLLRHVIGPLVFRSSAAQLSFLSSQTPSPTCGVSPARVADQRGRGLKRLATQAQLAAKRRAVHDEYQALAQSEAEQAVNQQIMEIVRQLTASPDRIGAVMMALRNSSDADAAEERKKQFFPKTYIYLYKVPKEWIVNHTLPSLCQRLTPQVVNHLWKADRRIDLKLLSMATGSTEKAKISSYNKDMFDDIATKHHNSIMNRVLDRVSWDADHKVDWQSCGSDFRGAWERLAG